MVSTSTVTGKRTCVPTLVSVQYTKNKPAGERKMARRIGRGVLHYVLAVCELGGSVT